MNKQKQISMISMISIVAAIVFWWSCENNKPDNFGRESYDPSKPVKVTGFEPDSGGMATKVFITGSNFGSDLSKIKVYFNEMSAPVVGSDGSHLYVITPRQPGRENTISVLVGKDSVAFTDKKYLYRTMTTVTTITGKKGTTEFKGGTLSEAEFECPSTLCVDAEGNIFLSNWDYDSNRRPAACHFVLINQEKDIVQSLWSGARTGSPTADAEGKVIMVPFDCNDSYISFDPDAQWAPKQRLMLHPTAEMIAAGKQDFNVTSGTCRLGMWACLLDGYIYTHYNNGQLIKFDPITRVGELVETLTSAGSFTYINPYQPNIVYLIFQGRHMIWTYDILTGEYERFAGTDSRAGWVDGHRLVAEFNMPSQMIIDEDGSIYLADRANHCIRKITPDGMVSTIIGKGGVAGYQDGNPEDALFDNPRGVAIDKEGVVYIADYGNNCVRKLAVE